MFEMKKYYNENEGELEKLFDGWDYLTNTQIKEYNTWKAIIKNVNLDDEKSVNQVLEYFSDDETDDVLSKAINYPGDGKVDYKYYVHTKDKIPLWPVQKLWISHAILSQASDLDELGVLLLSYFASSITGPFTLAMVLTSLTENIIEIKKIDMVDRGKGVVAIWEPAPPIGTNFKLIAQ